MYKRNFFSPRCEEDTRQEGKLIISTGNFASNGDLKLETQKSEKNKIFWDLSIRTEKLVNDRSNITVLDKEKQCCLLTDPLCTFVSRLENKEEEKQSRIKFEIRRIWSMKTVKIVPTVIGIFL